MARTSHSVHRPKHVPQDTKAEIVPKKPPHRTMHAIAGYDDVTVTPIEGTDEELLMLPIRYSYPHNPKT